MFRLVYVTVPPALPQGGPCQIHAGFGSTSLPGRQRHQRTNAVPIHVLFVYSWKILGAVFYKHVSSRNTYHR